MRTDAQLITDATVIKNATSPNSNSANRIGNMLLDIIKNKTNKIYLYATTGTNNYAITVDASITSYALGQWYFVSFGNANTGAVTLDINGLGALSVKKQDGTALATGDLPAGSIQLLVYDGTNLQCLSIASGSGASDTFTGNVTFVLSPDKSFGKYKNGQTALWNGFTAIQALLDAAIEYINPVFTSFAVFQQQTVEVGTTLSGTKSFIWTIAVNSGTVPTVNIVDNNTSTNLATNTANDGTQLQLITTIQLNSDGATQSWRMIGNNTSPAGTFSSGNYVVTSRFLMWWDAVIASLTDSASVRALTNSQFNTGAGQVTLNTGTVKTKFVFASTSSITKVEDLDALGADITSLYVLQASINVIDAGGTPRANFIYEANVGEAYDVNHRHVITYN
jgi:hypothetical protein